jgi:undecaprenyl-diphosphatase
VNELTLWQAAILGLVQGLAEFLPISSSAHLSLTPWIFGWPAPGLAFDVALHLGTLTAVLWYFRTEWVALIKAGIRLVGAGGRPRDDDERRVILLIIGTIPAALGGLLLEDYAETVFRAPVITASALIVLGIILWAVDRHAPSTRALASFRWRDAVIVGLAQVAALVPGVSRSGATITAGRAIGADRGSAAVFSFLLSMPITVAAAILKTPDAVRESNALLPLAVGITTAAASGWFAIAVLLRFVKTNGYGIFAGYRVVLGVVILGLLAAKGAP